MFFVAALVIILAISTFTQYYFGITYSILLQADQRSYIGNVIQIITVLLNTVVSVILLNIVCTVHIVKLVSTAVYVLRPLLLNLIARKYYKIDKTIKPDNEAIRQRWNGFGYHLAFYIHNNVDVFVVTTILGLKWASVYSVYYMIVAGVKNIVTSLTGSSEAAFGNMIAKKEQKVLEDRFCMIETLSSMFIVSFFATTGLLLLDFIGIYTGGVEDDSLSLQWATEAIRNYLENGEFTATSLNSLEKMYFMPSILTLLIGDGRYAGSGVGYYMNTDVGFMRGILYFGIFGVISLYSIVLCNIYNMRKFRDFKGYNMFCCIRA